MDVFDLCYDIIGAAFEVRKILGPYMLEAVYEVALMQELQLRGIECRNQVLIPVEYKGMKIASGFRADILVEEEVIVELKALRKFEGHEFRQLSSYLKLSGLKNGLLINFGKEDFKVHRRGEEMGEASIFKFVGK